MRHGQSVLVVRDAKTTLVLDTCPIAAPGAYADNGAYVNFRSQSSKAKYSNEKQEERPMPGFIRPSGHLPPGSGPGPSRLSG